MNPFESRFRRVCQAVAVLAFVAVSSNVVVAAKPVIALKPNHKHFLWKVESKTNTIYLVGSIHAARKELYPLPRVINQAFEKSDVLVTEVPMDAASLLAGGTKMIQAATLPMGDTLDKHLDKETRKLLAEYSKKSKFPVAGLQRFRPWLAGMMIMQLEMPRHGYSAQHGIDQHFVNRARKKKMPMKGLETYDDQISIFANLPEKKQLKFLKETLKETGKLGAMLDGMFSAWKRGDVKKLDELALKDLRKDDDKALYQGLIVKRNNAWMKTIVKWLKGPKKTYFIVVGSGHLLGKEGLVEQLRAMKKYKIQQY